MSVGDAAKAALMHCIGRKPAAVFGSTEQECRLMASLAQDAAEDIAQTHDWRRLVKVHTFPAGTSTAPLPADYDRMVYGTRIGGTYPIEDIDEWVNTDCAGWILLGGNIEFRPAAGPDARMSYVTNQWARRSDGAKANSFVHDDDQFLVSDQLLRLSLIWRYKEATGLDYSEDLVNYGTAVAQARMRDKGSYVVPTPMRVFDPKTYSGRARP